MQHSAENSRASTFSSIAPAMPPRLSWVPIPISDAKAWVSDLSDTETGWFWTLIFSSLAAEPQGYLLDSSNLWTIAGAKRSDFWESHKSRVLARFEVREMDGMRMRCFPPLVEIIGQQSRKLHRPRSSLLSLSSLDPKNQNQNQRESKPRAKNEAKQYERRTGTRQPTRLDRFIPD